MKHNQDDPRALASRARVGDMLLRRGTAVGMLVIILILGINAPSFFTFKNLMDILKQSGILELIAIRQTIVLISGRFDMSAGALLQLTANLSAGFVLAGYGTGTVILIGLAAGVLAGAINAFFVVKVHVPSFVATLGMMLVMNGVTTWYNDGKSITLRNETAFFTLGQGYIGPIPILFVIVLAFIACIHLFLKHTRTGLRMYAVGENSQAAHIRGVRQGTALMISFIMAGALVGLTGVFQASYSYGSSAIAAGLDFLLNALAASLLGTTYSRTGELSVIGTAVSALFISSLSSGLIANGVSNLLQPGVLGLILVVSVLLTVIRKREIGQVTIF